MSTPKKTTRVKKVAPTNPVEAAPATVAPSNTAVEERSGAAAASAEAKEVVPSAAPAATPSTPPVGELFTIRTVISPAPVDEENLRIVKDVGEIAVLSTFRANPVCMGDAEEVSGMDLLARVKATGVCGEAHMNAILAKSDQIPPALDFLFLAFLGTLRRDPESKTFYVKGLSKEGGRWTVCVASLAYKWRRKDRFVTEE